MQCLAVVFGIIPLHVVIIVLSVVGNSLRLCVTSSASSSSCDCCSCCDRLTASSACNGLACPVLMLAIALIFSDRFSPVATKVVLVGLLVLTIGFLIAVILTNVMLQKLLLESTSGSSSSRDNPATPMPERALTLTVTNDWKKSFGMSLVGQGVYTLAPDGLAALAGLRVEDLVLRVDGEEIDSQDRLYDYFRSVAHGATVVFTISRCGPPDTV